MINPNTPAGIQSARSRSTGLIFLHDIKVDSELKQLFNLEIVADRISDAGEMAYKGNSRSRSGSDSSHSRTPCFSVDGAPLTE